MKPSKPYVVGLTGGIASGKSTLARALSEAGAPLIDADQVARGQTAQGGAALPAIRAAFGERVFDGEALNRRALAAHVFANKDALATLNSITHPLILQEIDRRIAALQDAPAVVLDVPLLYEVGWDSRCDEVWCAWVPVWRQMIRLMRRDGLSPLHAWRRIKSQMPGRERRNRADHVVDTSGTKQQSARRVLALWNNVLKKVNHGQA